MDGKSITGVNRSADEDTWTPLHRSAFTGDHETVVELLRQGSSVSELSSNGRTPLMLASLQGHDRVVSALLAQTTDADIDVKDNEGRTALHHATDNVNASIVELLIERGADLDTVDIQGIAPLHTAIANNSLELVRCFLNAGVKVNIADPKDGFVGLHIAAQEGFCDIMELLLDHVDTDINVKNVNGYTPLHSAAYCNRPDAVKMLLQRGADVRKTTDEGDTPIISAAVNNSIDSLSVLLNHDNTDIDTKRRFNGATALAIAAYMGYSAVVEKLIAYGANVDAIDDDGRTPLHYLVDHNPGEKKSTHSGHFKVAELLIKSGRATVTFTANMDTFDVQGFTPLQTGIANNSLELVKCFLNAGAKVNIANPKTGFVGLHIAAQEGFCDIMELLLDHADTDINVQNVRGFTPLHSAAYYNRPEAVKILLQKGADVRKTTYDGYTAIICASLNNSIDSLSVLLNHDNSDIDAKCCSVGFNGVTALAIAASLGFSAIAENLIAYGANVDASDEYGRTALHYLVSQNPSEKKSTDNEYFKVAELLIKSGRANVNALTFSAETPLHYYVALYNPGYLQIMKLLIDSGADIDAQNIVGVTPLLRAMARVGKSALCKDAVDFLVENGADLYRMDCGELKSSIHQWELLFSRHHLAQKLVAQFGDAFELSIIREPNQPIDYLNNTRLHYAVGDKVLTDCRRTGSMVDFLLRSGGDLTVQNIFGQTPLHLTTAANLKRILKSDTFKAEFFLIKDKSGRTPLHTYCCEPKFNITNKQSLMQLAKRIKPNDNIQLRDLVNTPDDFGRIPLHYAAEVGHVGKLKYFLEGGSDCNVRDIQGRIPLHYAKTRFVYKLLLKYTKDERIRDVDGLEPNYMIQMRQTDEECSQRMKYLRTERFGKLQKYFKEPVRLLLKEIFHNPQSTSCLGQRTNVLHTFEPTFCAQEAVWKIWNEHDYAYRDVTLQKIREEVSRFIGRLIFAIGKQDPRFEGKTVLIGSAFEGTKTHFLDEFDFNIVLTKFNKLCKVVASPVAPKGFVYMKERRRLKDNEKVVYARKERIEQDCFYDEKGGSSHKNWRHERFIERKTRIYARDEESGRKEKSIDDFFDKDGILNSYDVNQEFFLTLREVLDRTNFWENESFFKPDSTEIGQSDRIFPRRMCRNMKLIVNKAFEGRHIFRKISVDIVPCFHIDGWWPKDAMQNVLEAYKAEGCNLVIECPHKKYPWTPFSISPTVRISFGPAESRMIQTCQPIAKAAYMVAKEIVGEPQQSYALKTALLFCIEAAGDSNHIYETTNARDLCSWVRMILLCFLHFSLEDHIPCYFMPTFHLPFIRSLQFDTCRQTLKFTHIRLFGAGCVNDRDVEKVARCEADSEEPVKRSVFHELMRSYFVYWFTCDGLTDFEFRFPNPKPLSEEGFKREELIRTLRTSLKNRSSTLQ